MGEEEIAIWSPLWDAVEALDMSQKRQLAIDFITKPMATISNINAAYVLRDVLHITRISNQSAWSSQDWNIYMGFLNGPNCPYLLN
jgi:hypothetical protein